MSETNLTSAINTEELGPNNYKVYRKDRDCITSCKKSGGGVLIAVKKNINSFQLPISKNNVEHLFIIISVASIHVIVGAVYIPLASSFELYQDHCTVVEQLFLRYRIHEAFIVGDYNIPSTVWSNVHDMEFSAELLPKAGRSIFDTYTYAQMFQINNIRNSNNKFLDLVFSMNKYIEVNEANDLVFRTEGYHPSLEFTYTYNYDTVSVNQSNLLYDFNNCDYTSLSKDISEYDWSSLFSISSVDTAFDEFYNVLKLFISKHTPFKKIFNSSFPRWFLKELITMVKKKKIAHKVYKESNLFSDYFQFQV